MSDEINTLDLQSYRTRTTPAVWLDVNSRARANQRPDLLPDILAINNSIYNLFSCPIGARGPIFQPTYGTFLYHLIHEPMDDRSAAKIRASLIQSLERWEPRIQLNHRETAVIPVYSTATYVVRVVYVYRLTRETANVTFNVTP